MEKKETAGRSNIVYTYGGGLYVNMTNRCTNECSFCVRQMTDGQVGADSLWLEKEPEVGEVIEELKRFHAEDYEEVIFCGYGEPVIRLPEILEISRYLKEHTNAKVRINTNGLGDLIHGKQVAPMMQGLIDRLSVSLNEATPAAYNELCKPKFGEASFEAILHFIQNAKQYVDHVAVSVVSCIPRESIEACRNIAQDLQVEFKVR